MLYDKLLKIGSELLEENLKMFKNVRMMPDRKVRL